MPTPLERSSPESTATVTTFAKPMLVMKRPALVNLKHRLLSILPFGDAHLAAQHAGLDPTNGIGSVGQMRRESAFCLRPASAERRASCNNCTARACRVPGWERDRDCWPDCRSWPRRPPRKFQKRTSAIARFFGPSIKRRVRIKKTAVMPLSSYTERRLAFPLSIHASSGRHLQRGVPPVRAPRSGRIAQAWRDS